jgi:hypothetical protein
VQGIGISILYLKECTGVFGSAWNSYLAYLLLDEAQQSYWDEKLWSVFFKSIRANDPTCPCVVVFASYGSQTRAIVVTTREHSRMKIFNLPRPWLLL